MDSVIFFYVQYNHYLLRIIVFSDFICYMDRVLTKRVCRSIEKVTKNSKKLLNTIIADIRCWSVEKYAAFFYSLAYARRKILTLFACQQRISAIAINKSFLLFFAVFFYIQQTFSPSAPLLWYLTHVLMSMTSPGVPCNSTHYRYLWFNIINNWWPKGTCTIIISYNECLLSL